MNTKHPVNIMKYGDLHQVPRKCSAQLDWEVRAVTEWSWQKNSHHATQRVDCEKIDATTSPLTSTCLTPRLQSSFIMCVVRWRKRPTKLCETEKRKWRQGSQQMYQFKQDRQKGLQDILKLSEGRAWSQWRFLWINLIWYWNSIHLVLVSKFDKVRGQCYFHYIYIYICALARVCVCVCVSACVRVCENWKYFQLYENVQIWKNSSSEDGFICSLDYLPTLNISVFIT